MAPILAFQVGDGTLPLLDTAVIIPKVTICTRTGLVTINNVKAIVVMADMDDDIILGRPELQSLGIDPETLLEELAVTAEGEIISHTEGYDDGNDVSEEADPLIADENLKDIYKVLDAMLSKAKAEGLTDQQYQRLKALVYKYVDIWRITLQEDDPAKVTPYKVKLKEGVSSPYRAKMRRYPPAHTDFANEFIQQLLKCGFVKRNPQSRWASPMLIVKKPDGKGLRFTVDLRGVNNLIDKVIWPMPIFKVILQYLEGSGAYASLDAFKGFWQWPLHEDSQELLSILTDRGVFSPTRLPQGCVDSVAAFQSGMSEAMGNLLYLCVLLWVDDLLCYAKNTDELINNLELVFERLQKYNI